MNPLIKQLGEIASTPTKTIIGLMSGTSLDGLDIALCNISGYGPETELNVRHFRTCTYPSEIVEKLRPVISVDQVSLQKICLLNAWLGRYHADLVMETLREWEIEPNQVSCIASHGQTIYHAPRIQHGQEGMPNATLQIGDGDHIARRTGILTLSDFRQKHVAVGGEGAPLASPVDRMLFTDENEPRILLNIGGIANFSFLPVPDSDHSYVTTDTGPGNTLLNAACQRLLGREYDRDGAIAASGTPHAKLLKRMKDHPYFSKPIPRTTGPEEFSWGWVEECLQESGTKNISPEDLVATLTWLSAETIADAIREHTPPGVTVYLSGGGMHNAEMVRILGNLLEGNTLKSFRSLGIDPDAKEAVVFAVLANECLAGEGFLLAPNRGAEVRVNFGKISLPV